MKRIKVNVDSLISKLEEIKKFGHKTARLSIVEGENRIPAHLDIDAEKDFRLVFECGE